MRAARVRSASPHSACAANAVSPSFAPASRSWIIWSATAPSVRRPVSSPCRPTRASFHWSCSPDRCLWNARCDPPRSCSRRSTSSRQGCSFPHAASSSATIPDGLRSSGRSPSRSPANALTRWFRAASVSASRPEVPLDVGGSVSQSVGTAILLTLISSGRCTDGVGLWRSPAAIGSSSSHTSRCLRACRVRFTDTLTGGRARGGPDCWHGSTDGPDSLTGADFSGKGHSERQATPLSVPL